MPDYPALMDPQTMGVLSAAFQGLNASGPSRMPVSLGQVIGQGGMAGLGTYMGAMDSQRKNAQTEALIQLEKQKQLQAELATRVQFEDQNMRRSMLGLPPIQMPGMGAPASPAAPGTIGGGMGMQPQSPAPMVPMAPTAPAGGGLMGQIQMLPPELRQAAMADIAMNGGKGLAGIIAKGGEPVIGREGGLYKRDASGNLVIDPGFLQGEEKLRRLRAGVGNENELVQTKGPNGEQITVRKSDLLKMAGGGAIPSDSVADVQGSAPSEAAAIAQIRELQKKGMTGTFSVPSQPGVVTGPSTAATSAAEASGSEAGKVQEKIDTEAQGALQSRKILGEMRDLSQDFTQGKVAPFKRSLGEWAQALNLPGDWSKEIKSAESQQALQKLTAQMATAAMKQFTNRGTQMEFKTFLQNNPNAELTPGGFQKVLEFMDRTANASLEKQQAYQEWRKNNPLEKSQDFLSEWNAKQNNALAAPDTPKGPPKPGTFIDGWEFIGGDPGVRMNWRKK